MEDIFKPQSLTIKQLFGNTDALYQIPRYQRPYSWNDEQLDKLWTDLIEAQNNEPNYFLGSIITAKPQDTSSNYIDIVDGQQRLTTLLILLCVYRDLFPDINKETIEIDPLAIDSTTIKSSIKFNDRFERLKLKTHSNHESDFYSFVLKEGVSIENSKPSKKNLTIEEEPSYKFKNTSFFFTEKLLELGELDAGSLINYIFNKVKIIRIDCQSVSFAIKLFQVLNDRGLDLSNSDLIKSFLIGRIHKIYSEDEEVKKQKENQFMDDWKNCSQVAIDTEESLNNLFVMYEYYLLAENPKRSLYDELEEKLRSVDPNIIINDFKKFVTHYKNDIFDRDDALIYSFWYLPWTMYWKAISLTALFTGYADYEKFLVVFRRFYYLNWIAGNTLTKIKQTSFRLIQWIKEGRSAEYIESELDKFLEDENVIERAISSLNDDIYYEKWCKPVLFMIELNQQDNPKYLAMWDRNIHTEHILPRAYMKNEDWSHFHDQDIEGWIHTGANLTLLSGNKNQAASYLGFDDKIIAYDGTGYHDIDDKKITSFIISQRIVNDYKSEKYDKSWNINSMNDRWTWFCTEIENILSIDLSKIKENLITQDIPQTNL